MAHFINGNQDVNHDSLAGDSAQPRTFQVVTSTLWVTIRNRAFAAGVFVGATLMYAGVRVAQHYLNNNEADPDRPF